MNQRILNYLALLVTVLMVLPALATAGTTELISVSTSGGSGNTTSASPVITADGRYVVFRSAASNLVPNDTNSWDVFVYDRGTGSMELANISSTGEQANSVAHGTPDISADGRHVAFSSFADNLVPNDTNGYYDIFVHDRNTGITERVSIGIGGAEASGSSYSPVISDDGRYVAFYSSANNLVQADTNNKSDIFVYDRTMGITERVSISSSGIQANDNSMLADISADGQVVAFSSRATNLISGDTNGEPDFFVHDRTTGTTELVGGYGYNSSSWYKPAISADGRYVAYESFSAQSGIKQIFVYDRSTSTTEMASVSSEGIEGNSQSSLPAISSDGRFVTFCSGATNLAPGDAYGGWYDVFMRDRMTGTTQLMSVSNITGAGGNHNSYPSSVSADGMNVAFHSSASNLIAGGTSTYDIYVRTLDSDSDGTVDTEDCEPYDPSIYPGAPEIKHDAIDQDCNGYDLTIDITKSRYTPAKKNSPDSLEVWASSDLDGSAALTLEGYGAMTWTGNRWEIYIEPAGGDPGTVSVTGVEGTESAPTQ